MFCGTVHVSPMWMSVVPSTARAVFFWWKYSAVDSYKSQR
jgi:hypothetical protein